MPHRALATRSYRSDFFDRTARPVTSSRWMRKSHLIVAALRHGPRQLFTLIIRGDNIFVRLPDWSRFVFGNLAWCPVPAHWMWVGLGRCIGIAHEPASLVLRTPSPAVMGVMPGSLQELLPCFRFGPFLIQSPFCFQDGNDCLHHRIEIERDAVNALFDEELRPFSRASATARSQRRSTSSQTSTGPRPRDSAATR